jgi:hypothetical protein
LAELDRRTLRISLKGKWFSDTGAQNTDFLGIKYIVFPIYF